MTEGEATRILLANDARVKAMLLKFREFTGPLIDSQERAQDIADLDTSFEVKSGVVTMDRLIIATHLMTAKIMFHVLPEHWKDLIGKQVTNFVSKVGGRAVATRLAKKIPGAGQIIAIFSGLMTVPSRLLWQAKCERDIRNACAEIRKEMNLHCLSQKRRRGRVQDVKTRHYRPRLTKRFRKLKSK